LSRLAPFLSGLILGALTLAAANAALLLFLPRFLVVDHEPVKSDAVVVLGGDSDGSRLRRGVELVDQGWAPRLLLTSGKKEGWLRVAQKYCPDCRLEEREVVYLEDSIDTRTDAQLSLGHCRENGWRQVLVVTSPYHSRRSRFVFNDIYAGSGIAPIVLDSGDYGRLVSPDSPWWRDRPTMETIWLEFGKILYWELTPFLDWQGEG
jgi:uncharacterized SAM-binding protein YcdF (DUF218 family)